MNLNNPTAYLFFNTEMDWLCALTLNPKDYEGGGWYLGGVVHSIKEIFNLMEAHGFDYEYFCEFIGDIPHWLYNALNRE